MKTQVLRPFTKVAEHLAQAEREWRAAHALALEVDEPGSHALCQILFTLGAERLSWEKRNAKRLLGEMMPATTEIPSLNHQTPGKVQASTINESPNV